MSPLHTDNLLPPRSAAWVIADLVIAALVVVAVALVTSYLAATAPL